MEVQPRTPTRVVCLLLRLVCPCKSLEVDEVFLNSSQILWVFDLVKAS